MGIRSVGIDFRRESPLRKETERNVELPCILVGHSATEPFACPLCLPGNDDIVPGFGTKIATFFPIHSNILDELEGIHEA